MHRLFASALVAPAAGTSLLVAGSRMGAQTPDQAVQPAPTTTALPSPTASPQASVAITTEKTQYQFGDTVHVCYSVPGPGTVTVVHLLPDGSSQPWGGGVLHVASGTGCFDRNRPPAGLNQEHLDFRGDNGMTATADTTFSVQGSTSCVYSPTVCITTDKPEYQRGETIVVCYSIPTAGTVFVWHVLPNGSSSPWGAGQLHHGAGADCFNHLGPPIGVNHEHLDFTGDNGTTASADTTFSVRQAGALCSSSSTSTATAQSNSTSRSVTLTDDFIDPDQGLLQTYSSNPAVQLDYECGEYRIAKVSADASVLPTVSVPGVFADSVLDVDARLVGDPTDVRVVLRCRQQLSGSSWYRADFMPDVGRVALYRSDDNRQVMLANATAVGPLNGGNETNHLELSCQSNLISASANGTLVASAADDTYGAGSMAIAVGPRGAQHIETDGRLAHLAVSGQPPPSGTILLSDPLQDSGARTLSESSDSKFLDRFFEGAYQLAKLDPGSSGTAGMVVRGPWYVDVSVDLDARLTAVTSIQDFVEVSCRRKVVSFANGIYQLGGGYKLIFWPAQGGFDLRDADTGVSLTGIQHLPGQPLGDKVHHLQLTCSGSAISASVDGTSVGPVQNTAHVSGQVYLEAGVGITGPSGPGLPATIDARLSNLVLTQP